MITKLVLDTTGIIGPAISQHKTELLRAGMPVEFVDFAEGSDVHREELVLVKLPDARQVYVPACAVESFHEPEETLQALAEAEATGVGYDTLAKAVREGRLMGRKSAGTWLSTRTAVEYALAQGRIRPQE